MAISGDPHHEGSFELVRFFAVVSLVAVVVVSAASSSLLSRYITQVMLQRDAELAAEFVNAKVSGELAFGYFPPTASGARPSGADAFFAHLADLPAVLRANIYSRDRVVLWSSDDALIGQQFGSNPELDLALSGILNPKLEILTGSGKDEHLEMGHGDVEFVENYLPVWDIRGEDVIGVVEIYRAPGLLLERVARARLVIWGVLSMAGICLFAGLLAVVRRGNRILDRQNSLLMESERLVLVGEMASTVAHGLRNPLASIRSSAELAMEAGEVAELRCLNDGIIEQVDRMNGWISGFLLQTGAPADAPPEGVGVNDVVADCVSGFLKQLELQKIELKLAADQTLPRIGTDEVTLRQVVNSLISNAIEAMPGGGELSIRSDRDGESCGVRLEVADRGHGLNAQVRDRLFEPFVTSKDTGLGLGLWLAKKVVEREGGRIWLQERQGGGVAATMQFPALED